MGRLLLVLIVAVVCSKETTRKPRNEVKDEKYTIVDLADPRLEKENEIENSVVDGEKDLIRIIELDSHQCEHESEMCGGTTAEGKKVDEADKDFNEIRDSDKQETFEEHTENQKEQHQEVNIDLVVINEEISSATNISKENTVSVDVSAEEIRFEEVIFEEKLKENQEIVFEEARIEEIVVPEIPEKDKQEEVLIEEIIVPEILKKDKEEEVLIEEITIPEVSNIEINPSEIPKEEKITTENPLKKEKNVPETLKPDAKVSPVNDQIPELKFPIEEKTNLESSTISAILFFPISFADSFEAICITLYNQIRHDETLRLIFFYFSLLFTIYLLYPSSSNLTYQVSYKEESSKDLLLAQIQKDYTSLICKVSEQVSTPKSDSQDLDQLQLILKGLSLIKDLETDFQSQVMDSHKEIWEVIEDRRTPSSPAHIISIPVPFN